MDGSHTHSSSLPNLRHVGERAYNGSYAKNSHSAKVAPQSEASIPPHLIGF